MGEHRIGDMICPVCGKHGRWQVRRKCCSLACANKSAADKKRIGYEKPDPDPSPVEFREDRQSDSIAITYSGPALTPEEMMAKRGIDATVWRCTRWQATDWEGFSRDQNGKVQKVTLQRCQASFERDAVMQAVIEEVDRLKNAAKAKAPLLKWPKIKPTQADIMVEISITDLHVGKLAWDKETGAGNYDTDIAIQLFGEALETLLTNTAAYMPEQILLVVGNDLLHVDSPRNQTTRGTPVDTDGRYQRNFQRTFKMIEAAIHRCREVAPKVKVLLVPGNHDQYSVWFLGHSLECAFAKAGGVEIDNSPCLRKYAEWGSVGLMFVHGERSKVNYPLIFASDQPSIWGRTKFREVHLGHLHTAQLNEHNGVRVRRLPSLCPPDAWHAKELYLGNIRAAEAYVWHKQDGLKNVAHFYAKEEAVA